MIRAVVFDVDGVLIEGGVFARRLDAEYGISEVATAAFFDGPFKHCSLGRADTRKELAPFLRQWRWPSGLDEFMRVWFEADSRRNDDLMALVSQLRARGMRCFVASTQEEYRAGYLEREMGFGRLFDGLFFSCRLGCEKPDPAFYREVQSSIGIAPEGILFLDDKPVNVDAARALGWFAEVYRFGDPVSGFAVRHGLAKVS